MSDPIEDLYPLSPLQQGMLFHDLQAPRGGLYLNQLVCELRGPLDEAAFRRAWEAVAQVHPILRTAVEWEDVEEPLQLVLREVELPLEILDLRTEAPEVQARRLEEFLAEDRRRGFDLTVPPLLRLTLIRTGETARRLIFTHHHLLLDGWSVPLVLRQLFTAYDACRKGQAPRLERPRPFRDYIAWLAEQPLDAAEGWFRRLLAGFDTATPVRVAGSRPQGTGHADVHAKLSRDATTRLSELCRSNGLTLSTAVQAAWGLLLSHHADTDDVVFGTTVSGRPPHLAGVEQMVGLFINTLPVRVRHRPEQPLIPWLQELQGVQLEARAFEYAPLSRIQRCSDVPPGAPLFESLVVFENYPLDQGLAHSVPGLEVRDVRALEVDHFPLTLTSSPGKELPLQLSFDRERFSEADAKRLVEQLRALLEQLAQAPARVGELSVVGDEERARLERLGRGEPLAAPALVLEAFAQTVAAHADAVAVTHADRTWSYRALDGWANAIAHQLRAAGVEDGERVGVMLPRSAEAVASLLGILKARAAFVVLDEAAPAARLQTLCEDAAVRCVLTSPASESLFAAVRCLAPVGGRVASPPVAPPVASDVAYVLYTSGTTGRPKGVLVTHASLAHAIAAEHTLLQTAPGQRVLQFAALTFDASLSEVLGALLHGAELLICGPRGGEDLTRFIETHRPQLAQLPPSVLSTIEVARCRSIQVLVSSGETCPAEVARRWSAGRRLLNVYGPTEVTISATAALCTPDAEDTPPIGRPLPGTTAWVLDRLGRPSGVGVEGELFLGGPQVAQGYLGAEALTVSRFVADGFSGAPGARLYRTGDRVFWRNDGQLQFVGRADGQVKLRGVRVELGEIEAALRADPLIRDAAVVTVGEPSADRTLAAFVVTPEPFDATAARERVARQLPAQLLPSSWTRLEELPLTPSGKVDRRALQRLATQPISREYTAAETETERALAAIWSEVLGVSRVGRTDHFFELGGHSLKATSVVSRVRGSLGVELPLRALFEAPTLQALAQRIDALAGTSGHWAPISRLGDEVPAPLSFAQERLWFLARLDPASAAYNLPGAFRLRGVLDIPALQQALRQLARRHEALRTVFPEEDGVPVQRVTTREPDLVVETLADSSDAAVRQRIAAEVARPFNLAEGPLFRTTLIRVAEDDHLLLLTLHHIVADGWSAAILSRELGALYSAACEHRDAALPELALRPRDVAAELRRRMEGEALRDGLTWWRTRLEGLPPLLELPTDRPRLAGAAAAATHPLRLPPEVGEALKTFCAQRGLTPFMALSAGFAATLHRLSGQEDFALGTPLAGRERPELEGLVGFFVKTVALRVTPDPRRGFGALAAQLKETSLAAFEHSDVPFERIVDAVQAARDLSHSPIFQVMFSLQNTPAMSATLGRLTLTPERLSAVAAQFELSLALEETAAGFEGELVYNRALFDARTIERWSEAFARLLLQGLREPERPLHDLELSSAQERQQLAALNETHRPYDRHTSLAQHFERQADATPASIALTAGEASLTFAALDARANGVARLLRDHGAGPGTLVAVGLERSIDLAVAILGVLKAGAAYVPVDPAYPRARLRWMLEDSQAPVLVTANPEAFPLDGLSLRCVGPDAPPGARLPASATGEDLAYAIYTSGSTGRPKAAGICQHSVWNLLQTLETEVYAPLGPLGSGRVAVNASMSFDVSVKQLFQLLLGRCVDMTPEDVRFDGPRMLEYLQRQRIAVFDTTPSQLQILLDAGLLNHTPSALRAVIVAGEAIPAAMWRRLASHPAVAFFNGYGPTECTVVVTARRIRADDPEPVLGRPLANIQAWVLDGRGRPAPFGVPGELFLGGACVARGYLGRPEVTAERFVPDPFSRTPGARLYRTGDRARWTAQGELVFLGRVDHQVKIRGHRIELGEVEAALGALPGIHEAVALAVSEVSGAQRLVAFVRCDDPFTCDVAALRRTLSEQLPAAMVPSAIEAVAVLPLSPSGKVDRAALARRQVRALPPQGETPPVNALEREIAGVWAELLQIAPPGREAHFFELGGHSLLAARVAARLRSALGIEVPVRLLFEAPRLSDLAVRLASARPASRRRLTAQPRPERVPLSYAQQRLWFLSRLAPESSAYHVVQALDLEGAADLDALQTALGQLTERHELLRTSFPSGSDGLPHQQIHGGWRPRLERFESDRRFAEAPFSLDAAPPWRAGVRELGARRHRLIVTFHHILTDGWSTAIFVRELGALYRAQVEGRPAVLAALPLQYADCALAERQDDFSAQLGHWKTALANPPPPLQLAIARPSDPAPSSGADDRPAGTVPLHLGKDVVSALTALATREGTTVFAALLSVLATLLGRLSGRADQVIGTPIAGRLDEETGGLIGLFINTLALRLRLDGEPTFRELLAQSRQTTLEAFANQEVAFERVTDAVAPPRTGSTPLFQVLLVLQNMPRSELTLPGLVVTPVEIAPARAQFDLSFLFDEGPDGLRGMLDYDATLFDDAAARLLATSLERLAAALVAAPDVPVHRIDLGAPLPPAVAALDARVREHGFARSAHAPAASQARRRIAPQGADELRLATLWRELLAVDTVYRDDDFFELGGHSLLAAQLWSRLPGAFGSQPPLRLLFDHPTLSAQAAALREGAGSQSAGLPPILPLAADAPRPLSFSQQRQWFLKQLEPASPAYNLPYAARVSGALDLTALGDALRMLADRHQVLRTCFPATDGVPRQQVLDSFTPPLRVLETTDEPSTRRWLTEEAQRPFDLTQPPWRAAVAHRGADEHWLLITIDHIASDGWSSPILVRELLAFYDAAVAGTAAGLSPLPIQYADFAAAQRQWLESEVATAQRSYWQRALQGAPELLKLPTDRPRHGRPGPASEVTLSLPAPLGDAVAALARSEHTTPFVVLLSAFQAVLARWSGQDDLLVGAPVAGRSRPELENLIGFFVNTVVLRARFTPGLTFRECVRGARATLLDALAHQELPFEQVVEAVRPSRDLNHGPLFQVLFTLDGFKGGQLAGRALTLSPLEVEVPSAKLDLALTLTETADGLRGAFTFDRTLFDAGTIERLRDQFLHLLSGALELPDRAIAEQPLWTEEEAARFFAAQGQAPIQFPPPFTLDGLFAEQVRRAPHSVALIAQDRQLTYAQLDAEVEQLALRLQAQGVGVEDRVGILLERGAWFVVSVLATLRAGGAFVPLDPLLPSARLAYQRDKSGVKLTLTEQRHATLVPAGAPVLWLDAKEASPPGPRIAPPEDRLAYVLYTSGSTGAPRGVMVQQSAITNRMRAVQHLFPLGPSDAVLLKAPISFDVSVSELFWPLTCGARLVIAPPGAERDPALLAATVEEHGVTVLHFVPSQLQPFVELSDVGRRCRTLRHVLCGGEALSVELEDRFFQRLGAQLHQLYGPTEASIDATAHTCAPSVDHARIPIGRPTANVRVHVLDEALAPVPPGVVGELFIGGAGVSRGYLAEPALTAERFLPDPWGPPGARLYRTGDLARQRSDGAFEFAGRRDHQVKVRGMRVELGEIEAALVSHPLVETCAVIATEDGARGTRLVAHVVSREPGLTRAVLEEHAHLSLPRTLIPTAWRFAPELPLTPNGKIDRKALAALPPDVEDRPARVPPQDALETTLLSLWEELLGQTGLGTADDFFALGGHSLLAAQLVARVSRALGREVPLELLFREPTVAGFAAQLRRTTLDADVWVPLTAEGEGTPLILVHPVSGHVGHYRGLVKALARAGRAQPVYGLQARGLFGTERGSASIEGMARDYVEELLRHRPAGPYLLGGWSMGGVIAFEMARQLEESGRTVEAVVLLDSVAPSQVTAPELSDEAIITHIREELFSDDLHGARTIDELIAAGQERGLLPEGPGAAGIHRLLDVVRTNVSAVVRHTPRPWGGRVILLRATEGPDASDPQRGWGELVQGALVQHDVPGDHHAMLQPPHLDAVANTLVHALR